MSKPTVAQLDESLKDLVKNWKRFALHLPGLYLAKINIIEVNKQNDVEEQKIALYDKWLKVYPDASWDDVVVTLEKVDENTIAKQLRDKYLINNEQTNQKWSTTHKEAISMSNSTSPAMLPAPHCSAGSPQSATDDKVEKISSLNSDNVMDSLSPSSVPIMSPSGQSSTDEVKVSEEVVKELDELHKSFVNLTCDVKTQVKRKIESKSMELGSVKYGLQEERAFPIPSLQSVQTTDELFTAIHPHYNFLNCYLIVSIALHFLSSVIADKATEYEKKVTEFMKTKKIRYFRNTLKPYHHRTIQPPSVKPIVELSVPDYWNQQNIWLVKMLMKTLFPVKHPDELPWYDIVPGSVIMTFLTFEYMTSSLIESSRKKTEFMRLTGVISLKIGDELVWQREDGDAVLSFEDSLIRATLADNTEAVQFMLQYAQVDINTKNTNNTLIVYDDEVFSESTNEENLIRTYYTIFAKLLKNVVYELHQLMEEGTASVDDDTIASIWHPSNNFMNYTTLVNVAHLLPEHLVIEVKQYRAALENSIKQRLILTSLETNLDTYFPTPFPDSIEVIITLHSVWSTCSIWYVEQLGQLIFTPTLFYQLQWFRVNRREESVRVCLLADGNIMNSLKECVSDNESRTSMLGVVSVQIDDTVMMVNDYSDGYGLNEAMKLAKAIGDDEISELIQQMLLSPKEYREVSQVDNNNNVFFSPDPDSTPLMIACCNDNSQLVQLLLDHNADPNVRSRRDNTALIFSTGNSKIFKMLMDRGADITNFSTSNLDTTLHFASCVGNFKVVKIILDKHNELVNVMNCRYQRPLSIACHYRHLEIVLILLQAKADPNVQDNQGVSPLLFASCNGDTQIVDALLLANADSNIKDNKDQTPLYAASCNGYTKIVEKLLLAKADPNIKDYKDHTPLYAASCNVYTEIVEKLLLANADPNRQGNEGRTPLYGASRNGNTEIVEKLLKASANPDIQSNDGQTALMVACAKSYIDIAELLLEAGADPDLKNKEGQTALDLAMETGNSEFIERLCSALYD